MIQCFLKFFCLVLTICCLSRCSFDPNLDALKLRVSVRDSDNEQLFEKSRSGRLYNLHCCKFRFRDPVTTQWSLFSQFMPITKSNNLGEIAFSLNNSYPIGYQIDFNLSCGFYAFPLADQISASYCRETPPGVIGLDLSCRITITNPEETTFGISPSGAQQSNCLADPISR